MIFRQNKYWQLLMTVAYLALIRLVLLFESSLFSLDNLIFLRLESGLLVWIQNCNLKEEMGIAGSHPHLYHQSMNGSKKYRHILCRHGVPKKYSLSAHLSYKPCTEEKFFPPPILHTKFHELNLNCSFISIFNTADINQILNQNSLPLKGDKRRKYSPSRELPDTSTRKRKKLSFPVSSSCRKSSSPKNSLGRKIGTRVLPTSSVSSGVDSVSEEDSEMNVEKGDKNEQCDKEINSKHENETSESINKQAAETDHVAETDLHIPRCSLDSGASFDEEDAKNAIFADNSAAKNFETVFEEERSDDSLTTDKSQEMFSRKKSSKRKKSRKFSLVKSFRKMSKRAISLPSAYMASSSKTELPSSRVFGSTYLNREWDIVAVQEMCQRMSLDQLDKVVLPLPDGATFSQILDESMIRQMVDVLPARAAGYPWINIYNSEKHGFSLHTFYRKMIDWDEEMSPILLVIRDCEKNVFGAVVSTTVRPCEHFFGTGDSCFLYKYVDDFELNKKVLRIYSWSGLNQFFVKASMDSLSIGASGGHYGLWLDADLNHGCTQACETFQNEPLAGESEDFAIQFVEAYGFRME
uniref:Oxidation resistance protein 1 n=2 Tax=Wuchereria bancrofti TaxID=6293 RepID=A0AAF5PTX1_WUCBA